MVVENPPFARPKLACIASSSGIDSSPEKNARLGVVMSQILRLCSNEEGQDIAEYAVMLAVILVLVIGTVRLVGGNANNAFSSVANSLQ
jgi:Flp pilus assembly pilin Flp